MNILMNIFIDFRDNLKNEIKVKKNILKKKTIKKKKKDVYQ